MLCLFGCAPQDREAVKDTPTATDPPTTRGAALVTLTNLVYVDATTSYLSHPLVCGAGRDFPQGREYAFRNSPTGAFIHVVFPEGITPSQVRDGKFVLHGQYQTIQNRKSYTFKQPSDGYQYFVVSAWEPKP
jgi:hypothetical protein